MTLAGERVLLRLYFQSADRAPHTPTWQRVIRLARKQNMAGATAIRGILGYGSRGFIRASGWSAVQHMPVIVEIVDGAEPVRRFVEQTLSGLMIHGLATLERAAVMLHRHGMGGTGAGERALKSVSLPQLPEPIQPLSTIPRLETRPPMQIQENGVLLRIFVGESDRLEKLPLYEAVVRRAREMGLSGATVLRGAEGFGAHSVVHKASLLELSTDLPIVIEIVDTREKIERLLPYLESVVKEGMITMENVAMVLWRGGEGTGQA